MASATKSAGTVVSDATYGDVPWANPSNATASDDTYATCGPLDNFEGPYAGEYLRCTNFGFAVPAGATIDGIVVTVEGKTSTGTIDLNIEALKGGAGTGGTALGNSITTVETAVAFGTSTSKWGTTWTSTDINASTFGVWFYPQAGASAQTISIDHVSITVYYTEGASAPAYVSRMALMGVG